MNPIVFLRAAESLLYIRLNQPSKPIILQPLKKNSFRKLVPGRGNNGHQSKFTEGCRVRQVKYKFEWFSIFWRVQHPQVHTRTYKMPLNYYTKVLAHRTFHVKIPSVNYFPITVQVPLSVLNGYLLPGNYCGPLKDLNGFHCPLIWPSQQL